MIRAVLFDMDGILTDTERLGVDAEDAVAKEMGLNWSRSISYELLGLTKARGFEVLKGHFPGLDPIEFFARFRDWMHDYMLKNGVPLKKGAVELLSFLKESGIKTAVATSSPREALDFYLQSAGVDGYFDAFISGENVKNSKPAPDSFLCAAEALGTPPGEAMVLEDSYNGIRSGRASGATVVMIPDLKPYTDECAPFVDYVRSDLTEVIGLIRQINGGENK